MQKHKRKFTKIGKRKFRKALRRWTPQKWEDYLRLFEGSRVESLVSPKEFERDALAPNVFQLIQESQELSACQLVHEAIWALTGRQKAVIKKIFFEGQGEGQVARSLGISRQGVFDLKKRGIRQLKTNLQVLLGKFPYVEAQASENKTNDDQMNLEFCTKEERNVER